MAEMIAPPGRGRRAHHRASICCSPSRSRAPCRAACAGQPAQRAARSESKPPAASASIVVMLADLLDSVEGDRKFADEIASGRQLRPAVLVRFHRARPGRACRRAPPDYLARAAFRVVQGAPGEPAPARPWSRPACCAPLREFGQRPPALWSRQRGARSGRRRAFRVPGDRLWRRRLSVLLARDRAPVPRRRAATRSGCELGRGIVLGDRFVPTDETMRLPVNYRKPGRFQSLSAARLLAGDTEGISPAGKIVLIGGAAAGDRRDLSHALLAGPAGRRAPCDGHRQHRAAGFPGPTRWQQPARSGPARARRPDDRLVAPVGAACWS